MRNEDLFNELAQQGNGTFLAVEAARAGLPRSFLRDLVQRGVLERTSRGVYVNADRQEDELYSMQQRAKKIVYSHETALFLHGLTDRTPFQYTVTVPSGYKPSPSIISRSKVFYIKADLFLLGTQEQPSGFGHTIVTYDLERTICDILRSRNMLDIQIVTEALRNYASRKDIDLNRLHVYSERFGVYKPARQYLEVLL